jgi:hypothetical protein
MYEHLFAIVERLPASWRPPASPLGPVATRPVGDLTLVASPCDGLAEANARALASHEDVVASTLDAAAVLPFRFGTLVPAPELSDWLEAHLARIRGTLAELRGCVEMRVKLLRLHQCGHAGDRPCPGCSGAAAELADLAERLVERAGVARWRFRSSAHGDNVAGSVAFLVPRPEVHALLARIAPVASREAAIAVVPTGPWPAYSFAGGFDRLPLARVPAPRGLRALPGRGLVG